MLQIAVYCLFIFQIITAEPPPPKCMGPPPPEMREHFKDCCKFPKVFQDEDFKECGIEMPSDESEGFHHHGPPDCDKQVCVLQRNNLMKDDTSVDKDAVSEFMQNWADVNEDFREPVNVALDKCVKGDLPGPPKLCEATRMVFCISSVMIMNCPKWEDGDVCKEIQAHVEECKSYFN